MLTLADGEIPSSANTIGISSPHLSKTVVLYLFNQAFLAPSFAYTWAKFNSFPPS